MTTRLVAALAAVVFALGVLTGSAATIVAGAATQDNSMAVMTDHMRGDAGATGMGMMAGMMTMMGGSGMGADSMPMADPFGPNHDAHHPTASPSPSAEATR